jgi:hypothetical protein
VVEVVALRAVIVLIVALVAFAVGWLAWKNAPAAHQVQQTQAPVIVKEPVVFATHSFDPAAPPPEMPPLAKGEAAECDSNFGSSASVAGRSWKIDATHAMVTVTQVKMTLQLQINIWVPNGASQQIIEHEEGHRQITEHYYQSADKLAAQIASSYIGKQVAIDGADLDAEFAKALQQLSADITAEYGTKLNPNVAQERYDIVTNHSLNEIAAKDAVALVLSEAGH